MTQLHPSYWTPRATLEALGAVVAAECARPVGGTLIPPEPGGGCPFPVDIKYADEEKDRHQDQARGRVVLAPGSGSTGSAGEMAVDSVSMCWKPTGVAHLWVPAERVSGLARIDAAWRLAHCVLAALNARHMGWPSSPNMPAADLTLEPDPRVFRNGQAAVITFTYSVPVFEGRTTVILGAGSSMGTVTPDGSGGGGGGAPGGGRLILNP